MGELVAQFLPFGVVLRRVAPAREDGAAGKIVAVGLGMGGKGFGHESELYQRGDFLVAKGIKDAVDDGPVVDGPTLGVFGVGIGGTPFEGGRKAYRKRVSQTCQH